MDNKKLFFNLPIGIVYQNPQGIITMANPAAEKITGLSLDQMQGKKSINPLWKTIKEDGSDFPGEEHPAMMAQKYGKPINNVIMGIFHPKKNDYIWIELSAVPLFKNGETKPYQVYTTLTDITKRISSIKALRESEEYSRSLLENIHVSIMISQGREIKYVNEEMIKTMGFSRQELVGSDWSKFVYHEDREFVVANNKKRLKGKKVFDSYLARSIQKNGDPIWFQIEISNTRFNNSPALLLTMQNVDEKVKSNQKLKDNEKKYKTLLEHSKSSIIVIDKSGKYIHINTSAAAYLGGKPNDFIGKNLLDVFDKKTATEHQELYKKAIESGESKTYENSIETAKGNKTFIVNSIVIKDENGNGVALQISSIDITELRETQTNLKFILENIAEIFFVVDTEYRITMKNNSFDQATLKSGNELFKIGDCLLSKHYPKSFLELWKTNLDNAFTGKKTSFESILSWTDEEHYIINSLTPIRNQKGTITGVAVFGQDVTQAKKANSELEHKEQNIQDIINNTSAGVWQWNIETGDIFYNEKWAEILGYSMEELSPLKIDSWEKLIHPEDVKITKEKIIAHFQGKTECYENDIRMQHKNGNWKYIRYYGKVDRRTKDGRALIISGTHMDVTTQKNTLDLLQQRLKFEEKIASISSRFIKSKKFDDAVIKSFQDLAELNEASRVYLFQINYEKQTLSNTHEWCNQGVSAEKDNLQNLPLVDFTWWTEKLKNDGLIKIEDVAKMPAYAKNEKEILQAQNISSILAVPLFIKNKLYGFIGFDNLIPLKLWTANDENLLNLFATILSNAIIKLSDEKALKHSESRFRNLFDNHLAVKLLIEPNTGTIIGANNAAADFYGWTVNELTSMNISRINVMSKEEKKQATLDAIDKKQNYFEFRHQLKNGDIRYVNVYSGHIFEDTTELVYSIIFDVTERKKTELQLRLISKVVSESPIGIAITNCNAEIEFVNKAFMEITGYSKEESIGQNPKVLKSGIHSKEFYRKLWNTILKGEIWRGEIQNKTKNGEKIWSRTIISPLIDRSNGKIFNYIWIQENISKKKAL